jgi:2-polyprenyl-6-methoxyphenol hydroxylase-like FAD-dependent oxidoreductase
MRVLIIGAGLGGLCLAQGLKAAGINVLVYERNPATADGLAGYGIHLNRHGWQALRECLPDPNFQRLDAIAGHAGTEMRFYDEHMGFLALRDDAKLTRSSVLESERRSVGRLELREILLEGLNGGQRRTVQFGKAFTGYETQENGRIIAQFSDGSSAVGDILVGADASNSRVRHQYLPSIYRQDVGVLNIAGRYALTSERIARLPASLTDGSLNNIVPNGPDWMFVAAWRNVSGAGTPGANHKRENYIVWAYVARRETYPTDVEMLDRRALQKLVLSRTSSWAPELRGLVQDAEVDTLAAIPLRSMPALPRWRPSPVTLIGDAIHNMTPMAGVGANTALRDAAALKTALVGAKEGTRSIAEAVGLYEEAMRAYANPAIEQSRKNALNAVRDRKTDRWLFKSLLRMSEIVPSIKRKLFGGADV